MKSFLKDQRAQGSIEMLLLLGAVVFVALVVGFVVKGILNDSINQ